MEECLVLFSGGKDSFISSCKMIEDGYHVNLISFNNGAVAAEENLLHGVTRLQNRYGKEAIKYIGVYNTRAIISRLDNYWTYESASTIAKEYPNLINAQITCLHCQSAMWIAVIAYALAHDIKTIVAGYRRADVFCTGEARFINPLSELSASYGIKIKLPVWDDNKWVESSDWERDLEMTRRSFVPQVLEPKCLLGRPVDPMTRDMRINTFNYFQDIIFKQMKPIIDKLVNPFKYIKLSEHSLVAIQYTVPDASNGIY